MSGLGIAEEDAAAPTPPEFWAHFCAAARAKSSVVGAPEAGWPSFGTGPNVAYPPEKTAQSERVVFKFTRTAQLVRARPEFFTRRSPIRVVTTHFCGRPFIALAAWRKKRKQNHMQFWAIDHRKYNIQMFLPDP